MFFERAGDVGRVLAMGAMSYAVLVLVLRISGKRTLAKLNAFDLIVTVALGSVLATSALSRDITLASAASAMAVLIGAQYLVAWASVHSRHARAAVRSQPALLVRHGQLVSDALHRNRVSEGEIRQAVRSTGRGGLRSIAAVVLETDGTLSVIPEEQLDSGDALVEVEGFGSRDGRASG
jgi:uncharacterized membrane protein YcaP (DUF421 family)